MTDQTTERGRGRERGPSPLSRAGRPARARRRRGRRRAASSCRRCCCWCPARCAQPGLPPPPDAASWSRTRSPRRYGRALELVRLGRDTLNSLLVAAVAVPLSVLVASLAGFALAQLGGRAAALARRRLGRGAHGAGDRAAGAAVRDLPALGLTDTLVPLIAPALLGTSPLYVLVYYPRVPGAAARPLRRLPARGPRPLQTWWRVAMPLVRPVTAARGRADVRADLVALPRPARLRLRPRPLHAAAGAALLSTLDPPNYPGVPGRRASSPPAPVLLVFVVAQRWLPLTRKGAEWLAR